jgi:hypothetical protein
MGIELKECPVCTKVFETLPTKCDNCGYDFSAGESETKKLKEDHNIMVSDMGEAMRRLRMAGIVVFAVGIACIIISFFYYFEVNNFVFISGITTGIITILCFFFVKKKPVIALLIPLILNISLNIIQMVLTFSQYARLTTISVVIIAVLAYSLRSMIMVERIRKRYNKKIIKNIE